MPVRTCRTDSYLRKKVLLLSDSSSGSVEHWLQVGQPWLLFRLVVLCARPRFLMRQK